MKKALAILLALSMVFAAFADEPATNYSVAEFKGSAEFGWKSDFDKSENGMFNDASATLKINLLTGGEKSTAAADGVWGELKIKVNTPDALENPGTLEIKAKDSDKIAYVDTAKIHFVDGDTAIALNMKKPDLKLADNYDVTGDLKAGFGIEVTTAPVALNVYVMDNGVAAEKAFGFKADASLKAVENLSLSGAVAYNEKLAAKADASYKIAIDDKLSLTPAVGFKMLEDAKALDASALFAWGGEVKFDDDFKGTAGVKVAYSTKLDDSADKLNVEAFDNSVEGLMLGAKYALSLDKADKGTAEARAKYTTKFDIIDAEVSGGVKADLNAGDVVTGYNYGVKVSTDDVVANTVLSAEYAASNTAKKGAVTVKAKISL
jgi:hypothetical protein